MQATVEDCGPLRKRVTVSYEPQEIAAREQELLQRYAGQVRMKGFRPGKTPQSVVRSRYGKAVKSEAREQLIKEGFESAVDEKGLQPIGPTEVEATSEENGLSHTIVFDVRPTFELPDPKSLDLPQEDTDASEEEVQQELDQLSRRMGSYTDLDGETPVAAEDVLILSGRITAGDETVREVQDLHHILGSYPLFGVEAADMVEKAAGKTVGDEIAFDTTLPENFKPEEWAGKAAHVSVSIQQAQRLTPATIDEAFATRLGAGSPEELRERVAQSIEGRKINALIEQQNTAMVTQLIERCSFDLPQQLLETVVDQRTQVAMARPENIGKEGDDKAQAEREAREQAERMLRELLIMHHVAETYDVKVTNQDFQQQLMMAAYQSGRKPDEIAKQLQETGRIHEVADDIRQHKALEVLRQLITETKDDAAAEAEGAPKKKKKKKNEADAEASGTAANEE
ncbi:MAG: trigger factor [Planctomycetota bacterium]